MGAPRMSRFFNMKVSRFSGETILRKTQKWDFKEQVVGRRASQRFYRWHMKRCLSIFNRRNISLGYTMFSSAISVSVVRDVCVLSLSYWCLEAELEAILLGIWQSVASSARRAERVCGD